MAGVLQGQHHEVHIHKLQAVHGRTHDTILQEDITDKVYDDFMHHHLIYGPDRQSHIDMWVSLVAFIYDFNFPESKQYVLENDYINRSFNRLTPAREDDRQKYEALRQEALRYIHE